MWRYPIPSTCNRSLRLRHSTRSTIPSAMLGLSSTLHSEYDHLCSPCRSSQCRRLSRLRPYFFSKHASRTYGLFGNAWSFVNLFSYLALLRRKPVKQSGGFATSSGPSVSIFYVAPHLSLIIFVFQIPLAGDIRPYFTMQDSDLAQLVNKLPPKAGLLLGVTNPFFEKSCMHWPHILSLGRRIP